MAEPGAPRPARYPGPAVRAAVMIMGVHGVLRLKPWIDPGTLEEDVFSLVVKRSTAYDWSSFGHGPTATRWGHNDAGGDWHQDGRVRELAWLQADVSGVQGHRLPVLPMATVLSDTLTRVGDVTLTGLHTLLPLDEAPDARHDLASIEPWYALADPAAATPLTVSARTTSPIHPHILAIAAEDRASGRMTAEPSPPAPTGGLARPLAGGVHLAGLTHEHHFRCHAAEWSLDTATWTTEVFAEALRATGTTGPALLTVSPAHGTGG
ncbi:hypothetical protein ABGB17_31100 [Sphaerisporangium sp. B11E5]|uniref:hypothetical protein n=1 Tax=Sphaerisporangium sp. B11E5 TaxID=3153563 RepID=UPI00325E48B4